jgi:signal peptidase I
MKKMNKVVEKVANVSLNILIGIFAIILLIFIYKGFQVKILKNDFNFFGYTMFEVQTGSMKSYINAGDWVVVKLTKDVDINDVITFKQDGNNVTHRVIEIYNGTYITKGDANNSKDDPIDQSQIIGKVVKVLSGFGILRKTIFNPAVIIALIITLLLFNLTFKNDVESMKKKKQIRIIVNKIINFFKNIKKDEFSDLDKFDEPKIEIPNKEEIIKQEILDEEDIQEEPKKEEELSKTSMFRVVSVRKEGHEPKETSKVEEEIATEEEEIIEPQKTPEQIEEELSKTSMFRIIKADTSDIDKKIKKIIKKEKKENKDNNVYTVTLEAEKVVKKLDKNMGKNEKSEKDESINSNDLKIKTYNTKAKTIIEKAIKVKKQEINQIIDVILEGQKSYVIKSSFRTDFIDAYITSKYYLAENSNSTGDIKESISALSEKLTKKNIRDEKQKLIIKTYEDLMLLYSNLDKCNKDEENRITFYQKTLRKYSNWDIEYINYLVYRIIEIQNKCIEEMEESYKKLETDTFEITFNKISNNKDLYSAVLNHNISFSSVYSDYIVDKTYNEGIVSEDKVVVLITLLSSRIAKDIMNYDYNKRYVVYMPNGLYEKEKKMAGLLKLIEDEYAKNHIYILLDANTLISNKKMTTNLKKQGYNFAVVLNEESKINEKNIGALYLADYIFVSKDIKNISNIIGEVPDELLEKVVKENIKKLGDFGGE